MKAWHIYSIAKKEIVGGLRDTRSFAFMLAFPIVLMLILGTALTNAFSSSATVAHLDLLYRGTITNQALADSWNGFAEAIGAQGINLVQAQPDEDGREAVRSNQYGAYAEISDDGIQYFGSTKETIASNILQGMLTVFADRYALAAAAFKESPAAGQAVLASGGDGAQLVRETALDPEKQPGSIDYYAMAMTTMIALYAGMSASFLIQGERSRHTAVRLAAAPVGKGSIFAGKVIGSTIINAIFVFVVMLFGKFVYQADWGDHIGAVVAVLLSEVLLAVSLGLGASFLFKGESARSFMLIFTQIASFIGGAYFPIAGASGWFAVLVNLSPLHWANTALTGIIYEHDWLAMLPAVLLNLGFAALLLLLSILTLRKREAL
ncbi:ABC transporter permease [Paenibacillus cymbidii]|uniref:ABC transporter permease n=1 Tax=Paenibacillus cymbidii TaxID=1639034 RepID=UPI0010802A8B|nr:ABC transporter permease [Paenibacillus cymbidii]